MKDKPKKLCNSKGSKFKYFVMLMILVYFPSLPMNAQIVNIPDPRFKDHLLFLFDANSDQEIQHSEVNTATILYASNRLFQDLTGIEAFTKIETLYCQQNLLTTLDLSSNTDLKYLDCSVNHLVNLYINNGNNHNLTVFAQNNPCLFCIQVDNDPPNFLTSQFDNSGAFETDGFCNPTIFLDTEFTDSQNDGDWHNPLNWTEGIPDSCVNAYIPSGLLNTVSITNPAYAASLTLEDTLFIQSSLNIYGINTIALAISSSGHITNDDSIYINNGPGIGILNNGTITNYGKISIQSLLGSGIINSNKITNFYQLDIQDVGETGIETSNQFLNRGFVNILNVRGIESSGIMNTARFENGSIFLGGELNITCCSFGITNFSNEIDSFLNYGDISIFAGIGIQNGFDEFSSGQFLNSSKSALEVAFYSLGISNHEGLFSNSGDVILKQTNSSGIWLETFEGATFEHRLGASLISIADFGIACASGDS